MKRKTFLNPQKFMFILDGLDVADAEEAPADGELSARAEVHREVLMLAV